MLDPTFFPAPLPSSRFSPDPIQKCLPKLLAAPRIAGLLPARVPTPPPARPDILIIQPPRTLAELFEALGPMRSRAEIYADLEVRARRAGFVLTGFDRYERYDDLDGAQSFEGVAS